MFRSRCYSLIVLNCYIIYFCFLPVWRILIPKKARVTIASCVCQPPFSVSLSFSLSFSVLLPGRQAVVGDKTTFLGLPATYKPSHSHCISTPHAMSTMSEQPSSSDAHSSTASSSTSWVPPPTHDCPILIWNLSLNREYTEEVSCGSAMAC